MVKKAILKIALLSIGALFLFGLSACNSDEKFENKEQGVDYVGEEGYSEEADSFLNDSLRTAYSMLLGQWQEFYRTKDNYWIRRNGEDVIDGPILTFNKDMTFSESLKPDIIRDFEIMEIYKLKSDTLFCHVHYYDPVTGKGPDSFEPFLFNLLGDTLIVNLYAASFNGLTYHYSKRLGDSEELTVNVSK